MLLDRITRGVASRLRIGYYRMRGVTIQGHCVLRSVEIPRNYYDIKLADGVALDRGVALVCTGDRRASPRINIREQVYVNRYTIIDASEQIEIGRDCMIGPYCYITDHDHGISLDFPIREQPLIGQSVILGSDVWLGAHVTVLKGVHIGNGAIVGAGSIVTRDLPPYSVSFGCPARLVRMRTKDDHQSQLGST